MLEGEEGGRERITLLEEQREREREREREVGERCQVQEEVIFVEGRWSVCE